MVKVNAFDLREAFSDEPRLHAAVGLFVEHPSVKDNTTVRWSVDVLKSTTLAMSFHFFMHSGFNLLENLLWELLDIPPRHFTVVLDVRLWLIVWNRFRDQVIYQWYSPFPA